MLEHITGRGRGVGQAPAQRRDILRTVYDQNRNLDTTRPQPRGRVARAPRWRDVAWIAASALLVGALAMLLPGASDKAADDAPVAGAVPAPWTGEVEPLELTDLAPLSSADASLKELFGLGVRTIVIDAGHGGRDPGAVGTLGTHEKDITLDVARRLRDRLAALGSYRVVLVRESDVFVPLWERAAFANQHGADLFVSIHVNYLPRVSTNAVETYYFGHYQDERTRKLAELENQGSDYSLSEFEALVRNMQDTLKLQESRTLAHAIQENLLTSMRARDQRVLDNGVRTAPFVVLLGVKSPSVLVEIGSLSSPEAERSLRRETYRDEIASYLAEGLVEYLNLQRPQEYRSHEDQDQLAQRQ
ncbi:MAG TPA: N-acetylmuramoyl-L-alanine amidase [Rhodocyclaceae bacterium]|nr:N-acetylmuramoyl-L-alanine amidase [Rhodocyclaceae bacterium]